MISGDRGKLEYLTDKGNATQIRLQTTWLRGPFPHDACGFNAMAGNKLEHGYSRLGVTNG